MIIHGVSKFELRQRIWYRTGLMPDPERGVICAISAAKYECYRPEVTVISYLIEPEALIGMEHDEHFWTRECNVTE